MIIPVVFMSLATASAAPPKDVGRTPEAVVAADESWSAAEQRGDAQFLGWLLEPGYVSVDQDGKPHDKAALVASAERRRSQPAPDRTAEIAAWRAAHPSRKQVAFFGDTAVLSFVSTKQGSAGAVNSSDVFVYRDGHWHPIYSQHSGAGA